MKLQTIINQLNELYPQQVSEDWDNVGLQLGDVNQDIHKIMTSLEITDAVVQEAIKKNVDLIVAHHPLVFKPLKNLVYNQFNRKIIDLIQHNIAVFVMHTNVDVCVNGMNDWLSAEIGLQHVYELAKEQVINLNKVNIDVCIDDVDRIKYLLQAYAINPAAFNSQTDDLFTNSFNTQKIIRDKNMFIRVECCILASDNEDVESILQEANFSNYLITPIISPNIYLGLGRMGSIRPTKALNFAKKLKKIFKTNVVLIGDDSASIKTVGVIGGSGASYILKAKQAGCDCLITGDVKYHDAQLAKEIGLCVIDISHYAEVIFKYKMKDILNALLECNVIYAQSDINPFKGV